MPRATAAGSMLTLTPVLQKVISPPRWFEGADGRFHMKYELKLTNAAPVSLDVSSVEVRSGRGRHIDTLSGPRLAAAMTQLGEQAPTSTLNGSTVGIVWVDLTFPTRRSIPRAIEHRLTIDVGPGRGVGPMLTHVGGRAEVAHRPPMVLSPPLQGARWTAAISHHRRSIQTVNGRLRDGQRFAVDWNCLDAQGRTMSGPPDELASSPSYRAPVLAVRDAKVVQAVDGLPELIPGETFSGGLAQADGNHVILKLGPGTFAGYAHLVPGSVRVRAGDHVRRGQVLGLLGSSGNSSGPHLHFQLMNRPSLLDADGLPFVLRRFELQGDFGSVDALVEADATGATLAIDRSDAGPRRRVGLVGFPVVDLPRRGPR
ncbi:M23 family metallopeptidase [Capillimicrobium parvum]|uniref:M23 family metallopeptidase n=1 Tax=Capillimicrobium parvum TaxID=2884022 RepID=UPI00216B433C|nr:M23 family metallopeptidase [Capillimicrobium parvum]